MANPLDNVCEKLTHIHMVVYTWSCWHIYKGDEVGVDVDQLGDETEARRVRNSTGALYKKDRVSQSGPNASVRSVAAESVLRRSSIGRWR